MIGPRVGCLPDSALLTARLRDAFRPKGDVHPFASIDTLVVAIARDEIDCTIVAIDGATFERDMDHVRRIRLAFPSHALVGWCDQRELLPAQLIELLASGIADLAFRGANDSKHGFPQVVTGARQRSSERRVGERLIRILPRNAALIFEEGIKRASEPLDVERMAATFGVTRRTLRNRLSRHGLPSPQTFLLWCRILVAGRLLDEPGRTLASVADQLNFSSAQNLGAALRRYVGANVTTLRDGEVGLAVEDAFRRMVRQARASRQAADAAAAALTSLAHTEPRRPSALDSAFPGQSRPAPSPAE